MFWCGPGYALVGLWSRGPGGLDSLGFSGTRPVKRSMIIWVDRKRALPR